MNPKNAPPSAAADAREAQAPTARWSWLWALAAWLVLAAGLFWSLSAGIGQQSSVARLAALEGSPLWWSDASFAFLFAIGLAIPVGRFLPGAVKRLGATKPLLAMSVLVGLAATYTALNRLGESERVTGGYLAAQGAIWLVDGRKVASRPWSAVSHLSIGCVDPGKSKSYAVMELTFGDRAAHLSTSDVREVDFARWLRFARWVDKTVDPQTPFSRPALDLKCVQYFAGALPPEDVAGFIAWLHLRPRDVAWLENNDHDLGRVARQVAATKPPLSPDRRP